jgi:prepilin signal peptidase PulO-like enzyme (type II secretory pathway)
MNGFIVDAWLTSPIMLLAIIPVAAIAARLLTLGVSRLVEPHPSDRRHQRIIEVTVIIAASCLWWWEVIYQSQLPAVGGPAPTFDIVTRYAAHMALMLLLAAAAWVDLRHRVIPDQITVPGVLGGLAWNALLPGTLLPIATYVERSYATPEVKLDVLSVGGGLVDTGLPDWIQGAAGLALAFIVFIGWWSVGTAPDETPSPATRARRLPSSRVIVAVLGIFCLVAAWMAGGAHWIGAVTAITGLAVSGGVVWATRIGASWALGREAMGFGDVTLMAMAGAWLGWQPCLLACLLGVFIGLVHGLSQLVLRADSELPFGPSLCLGLATVIVLWRPLWELASPQFDRPMEMAIVAALVIGLTAITLWAWARFRGISALPEDPLSPR